MRIKLNYDNIYLILKKEVCSMKNLFGISIFTLVCLYGLLAGIILAVFYFTGLPVMIGVYISIAIIILQFILSPWLTDFTMKLFYKVKFEDDMLPNNLKKFIKTVCEKENMKYPKIGYIDDGAPNAFTYGRTKNSARIIITRGTLEMLSIKGERKTKVIPYNEMQNIIEEISKDDFIFRWKMEQTKEARFMPSLVQNKIQIAFIINGNNEYIENLKKGDILNQNYLDDNIVKNFVNENYYEQFIKERQNKDDFFTNRESAILFGIPSCFIEGILVGREYEKNSNILKEIKKIFPECYICNLDGLVIKV